MEKKLTRSTDKMISGVAAGIAEYLNVDAVIIRVVMALLILSHLPLGLVVYIILAIVMPEGGDAVKASANPFNDDEIVIKDA
jgi:phage shock protein PspC (stress-responsive transcriptional regulator)